MKNDSSSSLKAEEVFKKSVIHDIFDAIIWRICWCMMLRFSTDTKKVIKDSAICQVYINEAKHTVHLQVPCFAYWSPRSSEKCQQRELKCSRLRYRGESSLTLTVGPDVTIIIIFIYTQNLRKQRPLTVGAPVTPDGQSLSEHETISLFCIYLGEHYPSYKGNDKRNGAGHIIRFIQFTCNLSPATTFILESTAIFWPSPNQIDNLGNTTGENGLLEQGHPT